MDLALSGTTDFELLYRKMELVVSVVGKYLPVDPQTESVFFGSAKEKWGFTLTSVAAQYAKKFGVVGFLVDRRRGRLKRE